MDLLLPAASSSASEVDHLLLALLLISGAVLVLVFALMFRYIVKYRASSGFDRGAVAQKTWILEGAWTVATLLVFFGLFIWGAELYVRLFQPPPGALKIYVIAKQWMWKVEHSGGQREINTLHLPVGRAIELVMTSEDVIHDFSVPAFRIKHDVLPDRYETLWFTVTRPGTYHLHAILRPGSLENGGGNRGSDAAAVPSLVGAERDSGYVGGGRQDLVHALRLQWLPWRQRERRQPI